VNGERRNGSAGGESVLVVGPILAGARFLPAGFEAFAVVRMAFLNGLKTDVSGLPLMLLSVFPPFELGVQS